LSFMDDRNNEFKIYSEDIKVESLMLQLS